MSDREEVERQINAILVESWKFLRFSPEIDKNDPNKLRLTRR